MIDLTAPKSKPKSDIRIIHTGNRDFIAKELPEKPNYDQIFTCTYCEKDFNPHVNFCGESVYPMFFCSWRCYKLHTSLYGRIRSKVKHAWWWLTWHQWCSLIDRLYSDVCPLCQRELISLDTSISPMKRTFLCGWCQEEWIRTPLPKDVGHKSVLYCLRNHYYLYHAQNDRKGLMAIRIEDHYMFLVNEELDKKVRHRLPTVPTKEIRDDDYEKFVMTAEEIRADTKKKMDKIDAKLMKEHPGWKPTHKEPTK